MDEREKIAVWLDNISYGHLAKRVRAGEHATNYLTNDERDRLIWRKVIEGKRYVDIARELGMLPNTVRGIFQREFRKACHDERREEAHRWYYR